MTLSADYLSGLAEGAHTLVAFFEDGDPVTATFTVAAAEQPTGDGDGESAEDGDGESAPTTGGATSGDGAGGGGGASGGADKGAVVVPSNVSRRSAGESLGRTASSGSSGASGGSVLARTGDGVDPMPVVLSLEAALALIASGLILRRRRGGRWGGDDD